MAADHRPGPRRSRRPGMLRDHPAGPAQRVVGGRAVPSLPPSLTSRVSHHANQPTTTPAPIPTGTDTSGRRTDALHQRRAEAERRDEAAEHRAGEDVAGERVEDAVEDVAEHQRDPTSTRPTMPMTKNVVTAHLRPFGSEA